MSCRHLWAEHDEHTTAQHLPGIAIYQVDNKSMNCHIVLHENARSLAFDSGLRPPLLGIWAPCFVRGTPRKPKHERRWILTLLMYTICGLPSRKKCFVAFAFAAIILAQIPWTVNSWLSCAAPSIAMDVCFCSSGAEASE
ncbi:unnamed protein product [Polarella glacialis]|uniref:Uncharacterized protein n=1 Tax=Polarella glacialis TaxID=89957 RepID=A0A813E5R2_POLGL|nr:unnamed protein product [Polarella glacialis]